MKVNIMVCYKDRPTELFGLMLSLLNQTHKEWDLYIMDDGSTSNLMQYHFIASTIQRLKQEFHRFTVVRSDVSKGVSVSRQRIAEYVLEHGDDGYMCRLDDDVVCNPDYLEKLIQVIDAGYDLASGVTPLWSGPDNKREVKAVGSVINRVVLDSEGKFLFNGDDCGYDYMESVILPTHHFRSSALYKPELHKKGVNYEAFLTPCGFREEEFFSFRAILAGYKLGVHTGAVAWHLAAPSGGDRRNEYAAMSFQNQRLLNKMTKQWFREKGDFIHDYEKKLGIVEPMEVRLANQFKRTNLIYSVDE